MYSDLLEPSDSHKNSNETWDQIIETVISNGYFGDSSMKDI